MGTTTSGFHAGELAVQRRAGVVADAARLAGMLATPRLDGGAATFLAQREFAVLTGRDEGGRLWTAPLPGAPGFLRARGTTLTVAATPARTGPLAGLRPGGAVGLIALEFAIRRRLRVNGTLTAVGPDGCTVAADQAFGNCPSYIQRRALDLGGPPAVGAPAAVRAGLTAAHRAQIERADTFFLGTAHATGGVDTSHKGGLPGFVRVEAEGLWWPDYAGNNMFNSLGNIADNPEAALLFLDFATGATLHLSGTAELEWVPPGGRGDDGGTGRRVRFRPSHIVEGPALPLRSGRSEPSPDNPALR